MRKVSDQRSDGPGQTPASLAMLLTQVKEQGGSDLHIAPGVPPLMRVDGRLVPLPYAALDAEDAARLCRESVTPEQEKTFHESHELDLAFESGRGLRCRGNLFFARGTVGGVFRVIAGAARGADELGLPVAVEQFAVLPRGLVLVTGATGSGKSTTLSALVEKINRQRQAHIVTIEDPIELLYTSSASLVRQREVGSDTASFGSALRFILRQDPDIVLIGEIRDRETVTAALLIADTGHLVFSTLHSNSAVETIHRVLSLFPGEQQGQARHQLSAVLQGIVCQQLIPRREGRGRVAAFEVLVANAAIRNLIREEKLHQIHSQLQVGKTAFGMQTMAQALADLCTRGVIAEAEALAHASNPDDVRNLLSPRRTGLTTENSEVASSLRR